ncbi:Uncharacterised protein [Vibrio cholerae]|nr:Uncharacterised protein [Vibrio cholerae]
MFAARDIIADNKGIFIEHGGLEARIWAHVDTHDLYFHEHRCDYLG